MARSCPSRSTLNARPPVRKRSPRILEADWVVLGPGSWFTSVIPHLMVPELREALEQTTARLVVVLNLEPQVGETHGYGPEDHLGALLEHAPGLRVHAVLAERRTVTDVETLRAAVASAGAALVLADLAELDAEQRTTARHDHGKLASAYRIDLRGGPGRAPRARVIDCHDRIAAWR